MTGHAAIQHYLSTAEVPRLHLGCGPVLLEGWLNADIAPAHASVVAMDATRPLPLPDGALARVFSEHMIEHLDLPSAVALLGELRRCLAPGGRVRIATPDLRQITRLVTPPLDAEAAHYVAVSCRGAGVTGAAVHPGIAANLLIYGHGHRCLFDESLLAAVLIDRGFVNPVRQSVSHSTDPWFRDLEHHGRVIGDDAANRFETLVMEATRG
ncbi:MAG: methyltransferase domain-containing protein [Alphaproteobacteria bacterium]|nr:methyltransferase domain-containing protein [Alphaproteobacteria bacterium]